jgi:hypothetical protein
MCHIGRALKGSELEKKTPDARVSGLGIKAEGSISNGKGNGNYAVPNPASKVAEPVPPVDPDAQALTIHQGNAQPVSAKEMVDIRKGLRQGSMKLETIPMRLDAFDQLVEEEEIHRLGLESRLTLENIKIEWQAYASSLNSNLTRMALTNAGLQLEGKTLRAMVVTTIDQNNVKSEVPKLLETLRRRLHDMALKIEVVLDEQKAAELRVVQTSRPLSNKEKLDKMKEINPLVEDLIKKFDLKLDM